MINNIKPFNVKIKKGKWWYKDMVGKIISVVDRMNHLPDGSKTIPIFAMGGQQCFAFINDKNKMQYVDPADVEKIIDSPSTENKK